MSMKSSACSKLKIFGGVSVNASSAEEERVLVRCFFLQTFNSMSSAFCTLTDHHTGVYLFSRPDEESTTLLCGEETVSYGFTGFKGNQRSLFAVLDVALVWSIVVKDRINDTISFGIG